MIGVPKSWKSFTLGELGVWKTGSTPSSSEPSNVGTDFPFVTPGDIEAGGKLGEISRAVSSFALQKLRVVQPPSVLLVCIGTVGKVAWSDEPVTTNQQINALEVDTNRFDVRFVSWLLAGPVVQELLWKNASSTTVTILNKRALSNIVVTLPPLEVQKRIVETLEDHLSRLDKAFEDVRVTRNLLSTARKSILHNIFYGIPAEVAEVRQEGELPAGWASKSLGELASVQGGGTPKGLLNAASTTFSESTPIPFYKVAEMNIDSRYLAESRTYISEADAHRLRVARLPEGSLVFPKAGGAIATNKKRVIRVEGGIDTNCMAVTAGEKLSSDYLYWFFESFNLIDLSNGSILPQISKKTVESLPIPIPPLATQSLMVERLEDQISRLDKISQTIDSVEIETQQLRRSLLHAAFTGQLTIEDSND